MLDLSCISPQVGCGWSYLRRFLTRLADARFTNPLNSAINQVLGLKSLKPSYGTNKAFNDLVRAILAYSKTPDLDPDVVRQIQLRAGNAEFELEKFWAEGIISSENPKEYIKQYPYYGNYEKLVKLELDLVRSSGGELKPGSGHRTLFIGSGPLSMSSLITFMMTGIPVDNIDTSETAIKLGQGVANALDVRVGDFILGDGAQVDLKKAKYDLIIVAALAGETQQQKQEILNNVLPNLRENGRIVLRSADGSRTLLYNKVDTSSLKGVKVLSEFHPRDDVINSVIICSRN